MDSRTNNLGEYHFDISITAPHFGGKPFRQNLNRRVDAHSETEARAKVVADLKLDFGMNELPPDTVIKRIGWDERGRFKRCKVTVNEETVKAATGLVEDLSEIDAEEAGLRAAQRLIHEYGFNMPNPQDAM